MPVTSWLLWIHLLATATLVGYYLVLAAVVIPAVARAPDDPGASRLPSGRLLADIERRAMPFLLASLGAFLATGIELLTANPRYAGVGQLGGAWATLLLAKHIVVVGMLVGGSALDGLLVRAGRDDRMRPIPARLVWTARAQAALGALVLLLTAAAQGA
ncbi:MAG: hypothetical protein ACYDAN_16210 [Candidatus Limnocylindrales bacterium]